MWVVALVVVVEVIRLITQDCVKHMDLVLAVTIAKLKDLIVDLMIHVIG
jgi:hypothetical protein